MKLSLILLSISVSAFAGEYAILSNGQRIHAESHERDGDIVRLITKTGSIELRAAQVSGFEQEEYVAPPPPAPVVAVAQPAPQSAPAKPLTPQELLTQAARKA